VFTKIEIFGGLVSLLGVIIIARPTFLLGMSSDVDEKTGVTAAHRLSAVLVSMMGVFSSGIVFVAIRKVGHHAHPLVSVSIFAFYCVVVSSIGLIVVPNVGFVVPTTFEQWGLLISLGISGFVTQFLMTAAVQREKAAVVAGFGYLGILWALLWERVFFNNVPDAWSWIGGSIILSSAGYVAIKKIYRTDQAEGQFDQPEQYQSLADIDQFSLDENDLDELDLDEATPVISTNNKTFDV
jgi:drug/metabolite transporter (DMT)-like permease